MQLLDNHICRRHYVLRSNSASPYLKAAYGYKDHFSFLQSILNTESTLYSECLLEPLRVSAVLRLTSQSVK
jgi:hypothetical protein